MTAQLGIIGGGQLARMLVQAAAHLPVVATVFCEKADEPAALVTENVVLGRLQPGDEALKEFCAQMDVICFENEFVPTDLLNTAAEGKTCRFAPPLSAMAQLRDKLSQKAALSALQISSARFHKLDTTLLSLDSLREQCRGFPSGFVLKWSQYGYDGLGTRLLKDTETLTAADVDFVMRGKDRGAEIYIEEKIPFQREVALVCTRGTQGQWALYPLVISENRGGVCHRVQGPATALGVSPALEQQAIQAAKAIGDHFELCGTYAVEFFETKEGRLLVNEIAPRVHNTGHYTLDAAETSQFENHLRGCLEMDLGTTKTAPYFAMLNLLGPDAVVPAAAAKPSVPLPRGAKLYWYDKKELRPGRKMGHINVSANSKQELSAALVQLQRWEQAWVKSCQREESA